MKMAILSVGVMLIGCSVSISAANVYEVQRLENLGAVAGTRSVASGIAAGTGVPFGYSITAKGRAAAVQWVEGTPAKLPVIGSDGNYALAAAPSSGVLVGMYGTPPLPVAWNARGPGTVLKLQPLASGGQSVAHGVNDSGLAVGGTYFPAATMNKAAFWPLPSSKPRELKLPPGTLTSHAVAVSNNGSIVGYAQIGSSIVPLKWANKTKVPTPLPSIGTMAIPTAINSTGTVIGWADVDGTTQPLVWSGSTMNQLDTMGGAGAFPYGINDAGVIVGWARPDVVGRAVIWEGATVIDLNDRLSAAAKAEGWMLTFAIGIDNAGRIAAHGQHPDGQTYPVLLTPVD